MRFRNNILTRSVIALTMVSLICQPLWACTGMTLRAKDGSVVFGRTLEWGSFDLKSRLVIVPRGYEYTSHLENGQIGKNWKTKYGVVGLDVVEKDLIQDGMNEKGLSVNVFYHPGFAEYATFELARAGNTLNSLDLCQYLLTTCANVDEARKATAAVNVVGVLEPVIGIPAPIHLIVTEPSGKAMVIEFTKGETMFHDAPLGVITNAPNYDWHMINLRNYLNLSPVALPGKKIDELDFKPIGAGSGMIGLPGDYTPPSRFVRAVAFSKSARPTDTGKETMYEAFRILDNFNLPLGAAEGEESKTNLKGLRSATCWTTAYDTKNLVMQYHTQHNRRVRQVDLKKVDFSASKELMHLPLDQNQAQDIQDVTPKP